MWSGGVSLTPPFFLSLISLFLFLLGFPVLCFIHGESGRTGVASVSSTRLHRAPDPPAGRVMTRRISHGAAAPPITINPNARNGPHMQNPSDNKINQSKRVTSKHRVGARPTSSHRHPEPQRDINISLLPLDCHDTGRARSPCTLRASKRTGSTMGFPTVLPDSSCPDEPLGTSETHNKKDASEEIHPCFPPPSPSQLSLQLLAQAVFQ